MRKWYAIAGFCALAALPLTGCDDAVTDPDPVPPPPGDEPVLTIDLSEPTATEVTMTVTPSSDEFLYHSNVISVETLELYHESSLEVYMANLLADEQAWPGMTREQIVARIAETGASVYTATKLAPNTEYVAFAMALDESGEIISKIASRNFRTRRIVLSDLSFECEVLKQEIDNIDFTIVPSNDEEEYFVGIRTKAYCELFADSDRLMDAILEAESDYLRFALNQGPFTATSEDFVPFTFYTPDTGYELVAFGFSAEQMQPTTELFRFPIRTLGSEGAPEQCTFEAKVSELKTTSASVSITPSDPYATYIWDIIDAAAMERVKEDFDDYLIEHIHEKGGMENLEELRTYGGNWNSWMEELEAGTQYYVWAVCVDEYGRPTAPVRFFSPFETVKAVVSEKASVSVTLNNYFNGDEVAAAYPDAPFSKGIAGKAYVSLTFAAEGEVSKWYGALSQEDLSSEEELSDEEIIKILTGDMKYLFPTGSLYAEEWDKPYTALAVAQDKDGNFTKVLRKVFTFTKEGAAPISQFVAPEQ